MSTFELRWAAVCARCILPRGALGGSTDHQDAQALFAADCKIAPWQANAVLRLSLWLTWFAPLWMERRLKTFGGLPPDAQVAVMDKLLASPIHLVRLAMLYLKLMTTSLLLGDEQVLRHLQAYDLIPGLAPARPGAAARALPLDGARASAPVPLGRA